MAVHLLLSDLLQHHAGFYMTGSSLSHPEGVGANTKAGMQGFFFLFLFHSFHMGDVIYNPFLSNLLFQIISHFIN